MDASPFKVKQVALPLARLTILEGPFQVSVKDQIDSHSGTLIACYIYDAAGNYQLYYVLVHMQGTLEVFKEAAGILPTFFKSPGGITYVSLIPCHPDKELEISIPVFRQADTPLPKGARPFTGDFIGNTGDAAIFLHIDAFTEHKPDKLLSITFKTGSTKKKQIKLPLPARNKICMDQQEIHLLGRQDQQWIHRQTDALGQEIRRRVIDSKHLFYREAITLSFEKVSYLLAQDAGQIILEKVHVNGSIEAIMLWDIGDPFYNTWRPVRIGEAIYGVHFNTGHGNGWFILHQERLVEIFYNKDTHGYRNLMNNQVLELSCSCIISGINKTAENAYAVVLYPREEANKSTQIYILNRSLD